MCGQFYLYVVSGYSKANRVFARVTSNGREVEFCACDSPDGPNFALSRNLALRALDLAATSKYDEVSIDRMQTTGLLSGAQIRELRRDHLIAEKDLSRGQVELLMWDPKKE